jgi:hypothetical protein
LRLYRDCGVTTLRCGVGATPEGTNEQQLAHQLDTLGQLLDLVREVNEEPSVR